MTKPENIADKVFDPRNGTVKDDYKVPSNTSRLDPDHPQWVRRRRKLNLMFGGSLATFLGIGLAAIVNMIQGKAIDANAATIMWPLGSAAAAAAGLYVLAGRQEEWRLMLVFLSTFASAVWRSKPVRWIFAGLAVTGAVLFILWRALSSAEHRGALKHQAAIDRQTLRKIDDANRAETDANSGSPRDNRLHDRFNRD